MAEHHVGLRWALETQPFAYETYNRSHELIFKDGAESVRASAAPAYKGDAALADPEDLLVAALSSCHMLSFLAIAARKKLAVQSYADEAVGMVEKNEAGKFWIARVVLRPLTVFSSPVDAATLAEIHHLAHEACFIANSVKTAVTVEPR
jgi:organic hydroperoxide reductase OsmC/OhrA